ncbi:MAG: (2Fe-2S)-binding protein [Pseudomonadota bacterium]
MFKPLETPGGVIEIRWEGRALAVAPGQTVAAALLAAGVGTFRETPKSGAPRGPFCLMGTCFECLVEIDGVPGLQACMTPVRAGMEIARQRGAPTEAP